MDLGRFSIGVGDRFGRQGRAQLAALERAAADGVAVTPVWNKSHREHTLIGTKPADARRAADAAVRAAGWARPYFCDADHIGLRTVEAFLDACDFFTIDVADAIGEPPEAAALDRFVRAHPDLARPLEVPGLARGLDLTPGTLAAAARACLRAAQEAGAIYRHIAAAKGAGRFVTEVSMDECRDPQSPGDLLVILAALADEGVPVDTIAPKFSGRFNKGVDYAGDVARFAREFADDLAVVAFAARRFGLPPGLKLSVHSGSDKFSLYGPIGEALRRSGAGLHLKTAGTTWLEEVAGLAEAGGEGLALARAIYREAFRRREELMRPYATVLDLDPARLPSPAEVDRWPGEAFVAALAHRPREPRFNPHFRQLLHVAFRVAAEAGDRYLAALDAAQAVVARNVAANLYERHLRPLFAP
jgi:hypothetical protein